VKPTLRLTAIRPQPEMLQFSLCANVWLAILPLSDSAIDR
jgi:hypothetical protein